jgi:hypothetical protein
MVSLLFEYGWKPGEIDKDGNTVAQWAEAGQYHILKEWIEMMERTRVAQLQLEKLKSSDAKRNVSSKPSSSNKTRNKQRKSHGHYVMR